MPRLWVRGGSLEASLSRPRQPPEPSISTPLPHSPDRAIHLSFFISIRLLIHPPLPILQFMTNTSKSKHEEAALAAGAEAVEEEEEGRGGLGSRQESEAGGEVLEREFFDKRKKERVKQLLLVPIRKFEEIYIEKKKRRRKRRPAVPFPYAYDDPAVAKSCFACCVRPPPVANDLPLGGNPEAAVKPSLSSYRTILKSLLEKNDFYSKECNVHCDVRCQNRLEDED